MTFQQVVVDDSAAPRWLKAKAKVCVKCDTKRGLAEFQWIKSGRYSYPKSRCNHCSRN